jgi:glycosyl transferase family 25
MKIICGITTIPSRFNNINKTINSLLNQTRRPDKIYITIPNQYLRFKTSIANKDIEKLLELYKYFVDEKGERLISVIRTKKDYGPGMKLLGLLMKVSTITDEDYILLVDDDHIYRNYMIDRFVQNINQYPDSAHSYYVYELHNLYIGQGADGFLLPFKKLKKFLNFFQAIKSTKYFLFHHDNYISYYLKLMNISLLHIYIDELIYKIHDKNDGLIDSNNERYNRLFLENNVTPKLYEMNENKKFDFLHNDEDNDIDIDNDTSIKISICIFASTANDKNMQEIRKINETWGNETLCKENGVNVSFIINEQHSDLNDSKYVYIEHIDDGSGEKYPMYYHGLKKVYEEENPDFLLICSTDSYINIPKLRSYLESLNPLDILYIGGHGNFREIGTTRLYFHDAGGIILSNGCFDKLNPFLENVFCDWKKLCKYTNNDWLINAWDVTLAYYLQISDYNINATLIKKKDGFFGCNYQGYNHNYYHGFKCCGHNVQMNKIMVCRNMLLSDFDNFSQKLKENNYFIQQHSNYNGDYNIKQYIDGVFYINLDKRTDRREEIETELNRMNLPFERFSAIATPGRGILGCGLSHLAVYKLAKARGYKNVLILEDDFIFIITKDELYELLEKLFTENVDFDVCMLSYLLNSYEDCSEYPFLKKVKDAQTASAYIVNEKYYDKLIELYEWAMPLLDTTGSHWIYANDQVWKKLQPNDKWYCFTERIGIQSDGFSDNANCYQTYNC